MLSGANKSQSKIWTYSRYKIVVQGITKCIGKIKKEFIQMFTLHFLPFSLVNSPGGFPLVHFTRRPEANQIYKKTESR